MRSDEFLNIKIRKIENGYVLAWEESHEVDDRGYISYHEFYAPSLDAGIQRLKTLFQGQ